MTVFEHIVLRALWIILTRLVMHLPGGATSAEDDWLHDATELLKLDASEKNRRWR